MGILKILLYSVEILTSFLLISVILLQKTKSGGMGAALGGGMGEAIFGAQMGNVLTKATVILAVIFLVNTTILTLLISSRRNISRMESEPAPIGTALPSSPGTGMPAPEGEPVMPPAVNMEAPVTVPPVSDTVPPSTPVEVPATP